MRLLLAVILAGAIYMLQKRIFRMYWDRGLSTSLRFDKNHIEPGERAELIETVTNDKLLPLPVFHYKFAFDRSFNFEDMDNSVVTDFYHRTDIFSLMGRQRIERRLGFVGTKRGMYRIESTNILVKDFFMTGTYAKNFSSDALLYVFPEKIKTPQLGDVCSGLIGDVRSRQRLVTDRLTFRGIRDYERSDSFGSINWKKSARGSGLMVNMYDYCGDAKVRILINLDTDSMIKQTGLYEESISLASTIAEKLLKERIETSLYSNGLTEVPHSMGHNGGIGEKTFKDEGVPAGEVRGGTENSHSVTIDKYLSGISGTAGKDEFIRRLESELRTFSGDISYVIISPYHKKDLLDMLDKLNKAGASLRVIVPHYSITEYEPERPYIEKWTVNYYES